MCRIWAELAGEETKMIETSTSVCPALGHVVGLEDPMYQEETWQQGGVHVFVCVCVYP